MGGTRSARSLSGPARAKLSGRCVSYTSQCVSNILLVVVYTRITDQEQKGDLVKHQVWPHRFDCQGVSEGNQKINK